MKRWLIAATASVAAIILTAGSGYGALATGGIITTNGVYIVHTFTNGGEFVVTNGFLECNVLIVGGGGAGGGYVGGGGGGGGVIYTSSYSLAGTSVITVGAGGTNGNGGDSTFGDLTAVGGGNGSSGGGSYAHLAATGGSGGGGAANGGAYSNGAAGTTGQGYAGGTSFDMGGNYGGGGGGGAGGVGSDAAFSQNSGGKGGDGFACSISGSSVSYAGGGGGAIIYQLPAGTGSGGGGNGSSHNYNGSVYTDGLAGSPNTGGGGGGGGSIADANSQWPGGSGVVIVNYINPDPPQGTITTNGSHIIHTYTNNGIFKVSGGGLICNVLVVGAGGGGGQRVGGGGGGGGVVYAARYAVTEGSKFINIGNGGVGATANGALGSNGQDTVFDVYGGAGKTITALGGGGGSSYNRTPGTGASGGSGGGGSFYTLWVSGQGGSALQGDSGVSGAIGYGYAGGASYVTAQYGGGGGGGAGGVGIDASASVAGNGGVGIRFPQFAGVVAGSPAGYFAGGGGAGASGGTGGTGGLGGGGTGKAGSDFNGDNGVNNTGGGGGGGSDCAGGSGETGGAGGSGVVIIDIPAPYYVWRDNPSPQPPFTNWATASTCIQDAVDLAVDGDTIYVTNGIYNTGGTNAPGYSLTNRVCITRAITLRSVNNDATNTIIEGAADPAGDANGYGSNAVRGVFLTNGASLIGFTVTKGHTLLEGGHASGYDLCAGGVMLHANCVVSNCVIAANMSHGYAGGAQLTCGGTLNNCQIVGNTNLGGTYGGGVRIITAGTLDNCTVAGNYSENYAGGVYVGDGGTLNNCRILNNNAVIGIGGVALDSGGTMKNCLVAGNKCLAWHLYAHSAGGISVSGWWASTTTTVDNCTIVSNTVIGKGGGLALTRGVNTTINNCIVWDNTSTGDSYSNVYVEISGGGVTGVVNNCCIGPVWTINGAGNIGVDPQYTAPGAVNFRLKPGSPCINTGTNLDWMTTTYPYDLDWHKRIQYGTVDMGAYERISGGAVFGFR